GEECALVIDAGTVSRQHARIRVQSGVATIEDLGSTNGTFVNGTRISTATQFTAGSKIALGTTELLVKASGPSAPTIRVDASSYRAVGIGAEDGASCCHPPPSALNTAI